MATNYDNYTIISWITNQFCLSTSYWEQNGTKGIVLISFLGFPLSIWLIIVENRKLNQTGLTQQGVSDE